MKELTTKANQLFIGLGALFISFLIIAVVIEQYILIAIPFCFLLFYFGWQNRNLLFFLLLATLPFSFEYNFSAQIGTDIPDEFLMLLVSFLFLSYFLYKPKATNISFFGHPIIIAFAAVLSWMLLTVVFSSNQFISIKYLLAKCWYVGAFVLAGVIVFKEKKNIVKASIVFVSTMVLVALISIARHSQYHFSFISVNDAVAPFFRNHVNYSAMLVCVVPVLFTFFQFSKNKWRKLVLMSCILLVAAALFYSYSRGAWLALIVGGASWWLIRKRLMVYSFIAAIIIVIGLLFWVKKEDRYLQYAHDYQTTIFHTDFGEHLISTYKLKDVSTAERFYRWIAAVRMIKDSWLIGFGPNTFYNNYKEYTVPAYKTWVSNNPDQSTVHNYFLLTVVEQGIPGLLFFLVLVGTLFYYAQRLYFRAADPIYKSAALVAGSSIAMIMTVNFLSDLIETDKVGSLFYIYLALLVAIDMNIKNKLNSSSDI